LLRRPTLYPLSLSDPAGHVVASFPGIGWRVSWSPDSTRVATWVGATWADLGKTIGIYGLDGVRQELLTVPPGCADGGDFDPVWSADGTSLVVELCVVPVDGRLPARAAVDDPRVRGAAYSRDGARMAFIAPYSASLVIAAADGTELRVLAGAENNPVYGPGYGPIQSLTSCSGGCAWTYYESPVVSPTGDRVAFTWSQGPYSGSLDPLPRADELRVVDVASGTVTTLATATGAGHLGGIRFSPEGDQILFSRSDANYAGTGLWSVHADGSDPQLLVTGTDWGDWQSLPAAP
jgi:Tol biopolymer transport system component